ncbi:MAG: hypothetical protein Kapaf2KO_20730 [Candidatus Kapaibacteriales bacterium]
MAYKIYYQKAFEQRCFKLIVEAYQASLNENIIQLNWDENDISSELHKHIKENPLRTKWGVSSNVEAHIPKNIPKVKGFANKFPRIDFKLTTFSENNEYEYFFEAKNLKQNDSALKRRYINTGINNFTSKKYENGSLIGYLVEGEIEGTVEGINSLLKKDIRVKELMILKEHNLLKTYYESQHPDIGILKHLLLRFS